jgi:ABC-type branched-subunit amino acid transport system substrate-binding protein
MTVSELGLPASRLPAAGRRFVTLFRKTTGVTPEISSIAAAEATEVLLDAIARSDGTRASVTGNLLETRIANGILGTFAFDKNGDTTARSITVRRVVDGRSTVFDVITP